MRTTVERVIASMIEGLEHAGIYSVSAEVALAGQLRAAGYAADGIVDRLKTMVMQDAASLSLFEVARDLRNVAPDAFTDEEWETIGEEFEEWQRYALDEPNGYFDEVDELDRVWNVGNDLGRPLDDGRYDDAVESVKEASAEAAERAMEDVEPDDFRDDDRGSSRGSDGPDESVLIDAIFSELR